MWFVSHSDSILPHMSHSPFFPYLTEIHLEEVSFCLSLRLHSSPYVTLPIPPIPHRNSSGGGVFLSLTQTPFFPYVTLPFFPTSHIFLLYIFFLYSRDPGRSLPRSPRCRRYLFSPTAPISPICRTPLFPYLTFYSCFSRRPEPRSCSAADDPKPDASCYWYGTLCPPIRLFPSFIHLYLSVHSFRHGRSATRSSTVSRPTLSFLFIFIYLYILFF